MEYLIIGIMSIPVLIYVFIALVEIFRVYNIGRNRFRVSESDLGLGLWTIGKSGIG